MYTVFASNTSAASSVTRVCQVSIISRPTILLAATPASVLVSPINARVPPGDEKRYLCVTNEHFHDADYSLIIDESKCIIPIL